MQNILPFAAIILALFAAGCVAFIAWELTKEASRDGEKEASRDGEKEASRDGEKEASRDGESDKD